MTVNGYTSRNIPDSELFKEVLETRISAKKEGKTDIANALKLVLNTTYGATLNQYNELYDPLMARSVCISGQIYLFELANHLHQEADAKIIQINTDGVMYSIESKNIKKAQEIVEEWQRRTGFTLEEDTISKIVQKDVNNYIEIKDDGTYKIKGGYLVRGISKAGAWSINNTANIVARAIIEYFVNGTSVEETINSWDEDVIEFQFIAKAGSKYRYAGVLKGTEIVPLPNKVNRVYASKDKSLGTVYKVKDVDGKDRIEKIAGLPQHCVIDNENTIDISAIDRQFYIDMATKQINDYLGKEPEKMAAAKKKEETEVKVMNVYGKLLTARKMFLDRQITKSGKNLTIEYKYYELSDIVPPVTEIFETLGLVALVSFGENVATMKIVNIDNPDDSIMFASPMRYPTENKAINPVQALGGAHTYLRRYLYMVALDICEPDSIEPTTVKDTTPAPAPKKPATVEERAEITKEETAPDDEATELQKKQLKKLLSQLLEKNPEKEEAIEQIAKDTKNFTSISKKECEGLIKNITGQLK